MRVGRRSRLGLALVAVGILVGTQVAAWPPGEDCLYSGIMCEDGYLKDCTVWFEGIAFDGVQEKCWEAWYCDGDPWPTYESCGWCECVIWYPPNWP